MKLIKPNLLSIACFCVMTALAADSLNTPVFQVRLVVGHGPEAPAVGSFDEMYRVSVDRTGQTRRERLYVDRKVLLDQKDLTTTKVVVNQSGKPEIDLVFTDEGRKHLATVTRQNIDKRIVFLIDGRIWSAPVIRTEISSAKIPIAGAFTQREAESLSNKINEAIGK